MEFETLQHQRRSIYALKNTSAVSDEVVAQKIYEAIEAAPVAFGSDLIYVRLATGEDHAFIWKSIEEALSKIVPPAAFVKTKAKLAVFAGAHGTILIYKKIGAVEDLKKSYPAFAKRQDDWGAQGFGIAAYAIWLALADLGLGANMQHYDPLADEAIAKHFHIPSGYVLGAEMVYGDASVRPEVKEKRPFKDVVGR